MLFMFKLALWVSPTCPKTSPTNWSDCPVSAYTPTLLLDVVFVVELLAPITPCISTSPKNIPESTFDLSILPVFPEWFLFKNTAPALLSPFIRTASSFKVLLLSANPKFENPIPLFPCTLITPSVIVESNPPDIVSFTVNSFVYWLFLIPVLFLPFKSAFQVPSTLTFVAEVDTPFWILIAVLLSPSALK